MALWQMMKSGRPTGDTFDDRGTSVPGDLDFSIAVVQEHVAALGEVADGFNYVGASPEAPL